jgi:hypothetical protein
VSWIVPLLMALLGYFVVIAITTSPSQVPTVEQVPLSNEPRPIIGEPTSIPPSK